MSEEKDALIKRVDRMKAILDVARRLKKKKTETKETKEAIEKA